MQYKCSGPGYSEATGGDRRVVCPLIRLVYPLGWDILAIHGYTTCIKSSSDKKIYGREKRANCSHINCNKTKKKLATWNTDAHRHINRQLSFFSLYPSLYCSLFTSFKAMNDIGETVDHVIQQIVKLRTMLFFWKVNCGLGYSNIALHMKFNKRNLFN